jgi:hypothetical protein
MEWHPIGTAPMTGVILLVVESTSGSGERRTFVAEASLDSRNDAIVWPITVGWGGWSRLDERQWRPVLWGRLPEWSAEAPPKEQWEQGASRVIPISGQSPARACSDQERDAYRGRRAQSADGDGVRGRVRA